MSESKSCDMSDDLHSSEMPLKKRKDSRLCNSESASWRIENSHTGNPLKKRFFRSLPYDEDEPLPKTSTKKKALFSAWGEEEMISSVSPDSILNENNTPIEDSSILNLHSADIDSHFSHGDKKIILKPCKEKDVLKSDYERDLIINNEHKLLKLGSIDSPCDVFAGTKNFSQKKENPVYSSLIVDPSIEDLSYKSSSLNSRIQAKDSKKKLVDAVNLMTSVCSSLYDSPKKFDTNDDSDIKRLKTEECNLIPENDKMIPKQKEERGWLGNTQPVFEHNVNENAEKSMLNFGSSSSVLSQNKVTPTSLISNYVDYFCNSEINSVLSQPSLHKTESLLSQENHSHSSGVFEKTLLPLQQSADNAVSFNKGDSCKYMTCGNSNPEQKLTSEMKKKDKYFSRPSSPFEKTSFQSNPSPLDFRLLLKHTVPQDDQISESVAKNERHVIGENTTQGNEVDHSRPLKSPIHFNVSKNNENSIPQYGATFQIPSNTGPSSSNVNSDYNESSMVLSFFFSRTGLFGNDDNIPSQYESHNINTSSSRGNMDYKPLPLDYKPAPLDFRSFKYLSDTKNNEDNGYLHMNCSEDKKDHSLSKNCLPQINVAKDEENSITAENMNKKMLNNQSELEQNLLSKSEKESKDKVKYFPSYIFSKNVEESSDNADNLENTLIEVCKQQLRNSTHTSLTENISKLNTSQNNRNNVQRTVFHECDKESEDKDKFLLPHNMFTDSRKEDKLKNALIEVCEKELKNSFKDTPVAITETREPTNDLECEHPPRSSYKLEDAVIDLCSNNDKRTSDDVNGDDDVKVIEVFNNNENPTDLIIESCIRPTSSKMSSRNELSSFESVFQPRPSTSKTYSMYDFPTFPLDMTNPHTVDKKSVEPLPSISYVASGSQQANPNKSKENVWPPVLSKSYDDYLSISSPDSVISISSSSPSSSPRRDYNQPIERAIEDEIFGSLIRTMDQNQRKHPSVLKRAGRSKEIPLLTLPEDESSDEEINAILHKKQKVPEKKKRDDSSPQSTSSHNKSRSELECAVCLESMNSKRGTSATTCGHVYCTPCIEEVIKKKGECPTCRKALDSTQVHKLFLFA